MSFKKGILYLFTPIAVFLLSSYMTVNILLKTGATVICPDLRGQKVEDAKRVAEGRGLSLSVLRYEPRNDIPYGYITVQKPEANITVRTGRVVMVLVSEGPELVELPSFVHEKLEEAEANLRAKQMEIEKTIFVPHKNAGQVVAQIPSQGTKLLQGSGVTLFVGQGMKKYYLMPDVKNADINTLSGEMDGKKIKYRFFYGREEPANGSPPKMVATPSKTIFNDEDEIFISVNGG
ncbi:MAG TPA: PASTA domain-containing protein [Syntrophorhabdaceae bacterium]|jgi:serine/threonine-protein kinase